MLSTLYLVCNKFSINVRYDEDDDIVTDTVINTLDMNSYSLVNLQ